MNNFHVRGTYIFAHTHNKYTLTYNGSICSIMFLCCISSLFLTPLKWIPYPAWFIVDKKIVVLQFVMMVIERQSKCKGYNTINVSGVHFTNRAWLF